MEQLANTLIDDTFQCWACPVFDSLFAIISDAAAAVYQRLTFFSVIIFCVLFGFYVLNAVWKNMKNNYEDPFFQKSLRPVLIKSLLALSLLSMGVMVPKIISKVTFEPVATVTLAYSKSMLPQDYKVPENYQAIKLNESGFFNQELRDTIIQLIETSIANFQVYVKVGIAIMDSAFSLNALLGLGHLIKHILIFVIGVFLTYKFGKLFIKYSFCFMDVIIAMAMFAFFFPLSVVFFIFKGAQNAPKWMENLGSTLGIGQIKRLISAIVGISATLLTYTVIMLIIDGFLDANGVDVSSIQNTSESIFDFDLENSSAMELTLAGSIVLVYVIEYLQSRIDDITAKMLSILGVKPEDTLSKQAGEDVWALTGIVADNTKKMIQAIANPDKVISEADKKKDSDSKEETKKEDTKKEDKK